MRRIRLHEGRGVGVRVCRRIIFCLARGVYFSKKSPVLWVFGNLVPFCIYLSINKILQFIQCYLYFLLFTVSMIWVRTSFRKS
jgi:hypothetical protein